MTITESLAIIVSLIALLLSMLALVFHVRETQRIGEALVLQTKRAGEALLLQQEIERGSAVMHFTTRYFDLVKEGDTFKKFGDENWTYQFWSLHATEFYFFHHGILPEFMYSLWMIDLAELYSGNAGLVVRESHKQYLHTYSFSYPAMISFFNDLYEIARTAGDKNLRNQKAAEHVARWIAEKRVKITQ